MDLGPYQPMANGLSQASGQQDAPRSPAARPWIGTQSLCLRWRSSTSFIAGSSCGEDGRAVASLSLGFIAHYARGMRASCMKAQMRADARARGRVLN